MKECGLIVMCIGRYASDQGLTVSEFARRLRVSRPTARKLMNGTATSIKMDTLAKICSLLKRSPGVLLQYLSPEQQKSIDLINKPEFTAQYLTGTESLGAHNES